MSVREILREKKILTLSTATCLIAFAIGHTIYVQRGGGTPPVKGLAWYTTDDGKTWFADNVEKIPPFDKDGKVAYGCCVWTTDGGKTKQVSNLYRYSEESKNRVHELVRHSRSQSILMLLTMEPMEVKRPGTGDVGWVKASDPRGIEIQSGVSTGGVGNLEAVVPE